MHKGLETLKKNNPELTLKEIKGKAYIVEKPWNDDSFALIFRKGKRLPDLKSTYLFPEFSSIYNSKDNKWEFIFSPVKKDDVLTKRQFEFNYKGNTFKCYFAKISRQLKVISQAFFILKSETVTTYRNLRPFKDYFAKNKPDYVKEYFKDRIPYSFYVEGPLDKIKEERIEFAKTLNFYLAYYDRESPLIQIFPKDKEESEIKLPCYTLFDEFPQTISSSKIDLTLLDIINVGHKTKDVRLEFIFYYQVIEYAAYYHLESEDQKKLANILKRPDINSQANNYTREIIEVLSEHFNVHKNKDKDKFHKAIRNHCSISDIKLELIENKEFFKKKIKFDGDLELNELFKDENAIQNADKGVMNQVISNIGKIRNVIVHLRESRENTVILPTDRNDKLLRPYLYLLRRIAEKVAIQFE
jgi:hypothetical protein